MERKTVLITGASRGIGRGIALCFAKAGYRLALCCHHRSDLMTPLKEEIENNYQVSCLTFTGDVGDFTFVSDMIATVEQHYGHIDVLVNNAGISYIGLLTDMTPTDWQNIIQTNLTSVFNCCHQVIPNMVRRQSGAIINISSVWGCCGASCEVAYSATKGGINALTQALAKELAPSSIQVNAIACGTIDTEMNAFLSEEDRQSLTDEIPAGRFGKTAEVGNLAVDLAGKHNYLTGQIIRLDGGWI